MPNCPGLVVVCMAAAMLLCASARAQATQPAAAIVVTQSKGFEHDVVKEHEGRPSLVEKTLRDIADASKLFTIEHTKDAAILTPEKLSGTKLLILYTTGDLPVDPALLAKWVNDGGALLGIHPATDTFKENKTYYKLIGGTFDGHPWNANETVTIKIHDTDHPATKPFGASYTLQDEIYQHKNFDPKTCRVLISLDMEKTALKKARHVPIAWCKKLGEGKVFYTSLGHREDVWTNPKYQQHLAGAIAWLLGAEKGDATPNPQVSEQEAELAKKAVAERNKEFPEVPDPFEVTAFVRAPQIKSPASIAVTPDGRVFVGEDEYNTGSDRTPEICRIKLCIDTDNDGKADSIKVFADKINSPQGMTYAGDTLYVVHAPYLTALRDTDGDGVGNAREHLVTGLGPAPEALVHHVPSGLHMGIDGWLYISFGDKGIEGATGRDGRKVRFHGGGVVRVRPDGTGLELYSEGTRNTYDVAIDPLVNLFTRDNTNDGQGWNARLTLMQRGGAYGYPHLFKNFADEIVPPIADYGAGSATGATYVSEIGFPGTYGESLYTCDWAKTTLYRHELTSDGASFTATQEEFAKGGFYSDVEVDGRGRLYLANWDRRGWGDSEPLGVIYQIRGRSIEPPPFPDIAAADSTALLNLLGAPSQWRRLQSQRELVRRGPDAAVIEALRGVVERKTELRGRVAAMYTLVQLLPFEQVRPVLEGAVTDDALREHALRALIDNDAHLNEVDAAPFVAGLSDENPRVRVQAAIGAGRLARPDLAPALVPLTADEDAMVRHAAMQSLRRMNAIEPCLDALASGSPDVAAGALRTLRTMHDVKAIDAIESLLARRECPSLRRQGVHALARLYQKEKPWTGKWWTPWPRTDGPHFEGTNWAHTQRVGEILVAMLDDPDPAMARYALSQVGLCGVPQAAAVLATMVHGDGPLRDDAAAAVVQMKSGLPEALNATRYVALTATFNTDLRGNAAAALGATEGEAARAVLIEVMTALDRTADAPEAVVIKAADAIAAKPVAPAEIDAIAGLLDAAKRPVRVAAATALLRSDAAPARSRVASIFADAGANRLDAMLAALPRIPAAAAKPYAEHAGNALKDRRPGVRRAAISVAGHLKDPESIRELVRLASRGTDRKEALNALAGLSPELIADDQIADVARLLVDAAADAMKSDRGAYGKLLAAAQKFTADARVPADRASELLARLKQPGVVDTFQMAGPIPAADGPASFGTRAPPEQQPGGPFAPFIVGDKTYQWTPLSITDARGLQPLEMPANSMIYLSATIDAPSAGAAILSCASDDGIQVWLNGNIVHTNDIDRGALPDMDRLPVALTAGANVLLVKVNNRSGAAGVQARIRTRVAEFDPAELPELLQRDKIPGDASRGRAVFASVGCNKCHAIDPKEDPKGPFLGDAGAKFDRAHFIESVLNPAAKIAQGFHTQKLTTSGSGGAGGAEYIGFVTRDSEEIHIRDLTGKVSVLSPDSIKDRQTLPGSIMPTGIAETLSLDDFASLMAYLESLKP